MNKAIFSLLLSCSYLSGCVSNYTIQPNSPTAEITFQASSDSTSTTGKHFNIFNYKEDCSGRARIDSEIFADDKVIFPPALITASEKFIFEFEYSEARFGQVRNCNVQGYFTPEPKQKYVIEYQSREQATKCGVTVKKVTNNTNNQVEVTYPAFVCAETMKGELLRNGQPLFLNFKIERMP